MLTSSSRPLDPILVILVEPYYLLVKTKYIGANVVPAATVTVTPVATLILSDVVNTTLTLCLCSTIVAFGSGARSSGLVNK